MQIDWNVQNDSCEHFALHKAHGSLSMVVLLPGIATVSEVMKKVIDNGGWGGISTCVCVGGWGGINTCVCVGGWGG